MSRNKKIEGQERESLNYVALQTFRVYSPKETFRRDTLLILKILKILLQTAWRGTGPRPTVEGDFWLGEGQALALGFVGTVWIARK